MKVKLISMTQNPIEIMWTAARTCYSSKGPIEMWETDVIKNKAINRELPTGIFNDAKGYIALEEQAVDNEKDITEKHWNLVKKVLDSGHQSVAEHVYFTFAIEGISRACSHQLVRHRAGIVFSQQSQRYVEIKEDIDILEGRNFTPDTFKDEKDVIEMLDKYFVWDHESYSQAYSLIQALYCYLYQIRDGAKAEDARAVLPNATKTNIVMTVNYRELIHLCNLRLCTRAQEEIRDLFGLIKMAVKIKDEKLGSLLVPTCEVNNVCYEGKCCGRRPHISKVIEGYKENRYGSK